MFKRIVTFVFTMFVAASAFANGYCDSRPSAEERRRCYKNAPAIDIWQANAEQQINIMRQKEKEVFSSTRIPEEEKMQFAHDQEQVTVRIDRECKSNQCVLREVQKRNNEITALIGKYHGPTVAKK